MRAAGLIGNIGIWEPVELGRAATRAADITFTERVRLWVDDRPLEVTHVGRAAHTSNDSVVWLPDDGVLFCGDLLFNGGTPFLLMGSVTRCRSRCSTRSWRTIPAHGRSCLVRCAVRPRAVGDTSATCGSSCRRHGTGSAAGIAPLEAARTTDLGEYGGWLDSERIVGNLHRAYADLDPSHSVDVIAALGDMVAYNGGAPLGCYA